MADTGCLQKGPVVLEPVDFDTWWRYKPYFKKGTSLTKEEASQKLGIRLLRRLINAGVLIEPDEAPGTIRSIEPGRVEEYDPKGCATVTLEDLQSPHVKKILASKADKASKGSGEEARLLVSIASLSDEQRALLNACVKNTTWSADGQLNRVALRGLYADYPSEDSTDIKRRVEGLLEVLGLPDNYIGTYYLPIYLKGRSF